MLHVAAATFIKPAQLVPHAPQFAVEVVTFVSQPSVCMPLQLPKPAVHVNEQVPLLQPALVVLGRPAQLLPQSPQFVGVLRAASQPLPAMASQLPKPAVHMPRPQVPLEQTELAFALEHVVPQAPQLLTERKSTSQPLVGLPSQFAKLALQVIVQVPVPQLDVPLVTVAGHSTPQVPQLLAVFSGSHMSSSLQSASPVGHAVNRQRPPEQFIMLSGHTLSQAPQLSGSALKLSQVPFSSQSSKPGAQSTN